MSFKITNEIIDRKNNIVLVACFIERKNTGNKINPVLNKILGTCNKKESNKKKRVLNKINATKIKAIKYYNNPLRCF